MRVKMRYFILIAMLCAGCAEGRKFAVLWEPETAQAIVNGEARQMAPAGIEVAPVPTGLDRTPCLTALAADQAIDLTAALWVEGLLGDVFVEAQAIAGAAPLRPFPQGATSDVLEGVWDHSYRGRRAVAEEPAPGKGAGAARPRAGRGEEGEGEEKMRLVYLLWALAAPLWSSDQCARWAEDCRRLDRECATRQEHCPSARTCWASYERNCGPR